MPTQERVPAGIGCLGTVVGLVVLVGVVVLVLFVGFVALAVVAGLVVVGLIVWAVDRLLLALSPKRRAAAGGRSTSRDLVVRGEADR